MKPLLDALLAVTAAVEAAQQRLVSRRQAVIDLAAVVTGLKSANARLRESVFEASPEMVDEVVRISMLADEIAALPAPVPPAPPTPTPAPVPQPPAPEPAPPPPANGAGEVVTLTINSTGTGALEWSAGQAFVKGDVPAGVPLSFDAPEVQAEVRNTWNDGSVAFAVVSGLTRAGPIKICRGGAPLQRPPVAEPQVDVILRFTEVTDHAGNPVAGGAFDAVLAAARANGQRAWDRKVAHCVRAITGPVMSEYQYFVPTADEHTYAFFRLKAYSSGNKRLETLGENSWFLVPGPGRRDFHVTLLIDGKVRYTSVGGEKLKNYHHTRWSRIDWVGADPQVTPLHDVAYLQANPRLATAAIKTLDPIAYSSHPDNGPKFTAWTRDMAEHPTPFDIANIEPALGAGGFTEGVGVLPAWDMTYLVEGNAGAYWAVLGNARAAGRYHTHYRDEATGQPVCASARPTAGPLSTDSGTDIDNGYAPTPLPLPTGGIGPRWKYTHGPKLGYLAYLLTGDWTFLEELQHFSATAGVGKYNAKIDGYPFAPWWIELRGTANIIDYWAKTAQVTPQFIGGVPVSGADELQRREAVGRWDSTIKHYWGNYSPEGTLGDEGTLGVRDNGLGAWYHNTFDMPETQTVEHSGMQWGFMANAWLWNFAAETPTTQAAKIDWLVKFTARWPVGILGASAADQWADWRWCTFYAIHVGHGPREGAQVYFLNWRAAWDALYAFSGGAAGPLGAATADTMIRRFSVDTGVLTGGQMDEIHSAATDVNVFTWVAAGLAEAAKKTEIPGAQLAVNRFFGSSSYQRSLTSVERNDSFKRFPGCAVMPRDWSGASVPAWRAPPPPSSGLPYSLPRPGEIVAIGHNTSDDTIPPGFSAAEWGYALFDCFGGGTFVPTYSMHGAYVIAGSGGHGCPENTGALVFDFSTAEFARLDNAQGVPNRVAMFTAGEMNGAPHYEAGATGVPAPPHPYSNLCYMPDGAKGSVLYLTRAAVGQGAHAAQACHRFDLSTRMWSRAPTYPGPLYLAEAEGDGVWDRVRNRWWHVPFQMHNLDRMHYLDRSDMTWKTTAPASNYYSSALSGGGSPSHFNRCMLIGGMLVRNVGPDYGLWVFDPDNPTNGWVRNYVIAGTIPAHKQSRWAPFSDGRWYYISGGPTNAVTRIAPPANPQTGQWVFDTVTLSGPALPATAGLTDPGQGNHYTRLFYVPAIDCVAWMPGSGKKVSIFRPPA